MLLPCPDTLKAYTGRSTGKVGVTPLIEQRLEIESRRLSEREREASLLIDEMSIKESRIYLRNLDKFVGQVDMDGVVPVKDDNRLANKMLAFVLSGLNTKYSIPVAVFLVEKLTGEQQYRLTKHVMRKVHGRRFHIDRLVTDNNKVNTKMFKLFGKGVLRFEIDHPIVPNRKLYLSFDYCHIVKNMRNLHADRTFIINGKKVTWEPIKQIYDTQSSVTGNCCKLLVFVRGLTRKHVEPNNTERQNVKFAIDIFSPEMIAALESFHENDIPGFEDIEEHVRFLTWMRKWFLCHDVSSTTQFINQRLSDSMPFMEINDERLLWLENEGLQYPRQWKERAPKPENFLTKETFEAFEFTTLSTVACIRYKLNQGYDFVLTRRFSSDNVERLFSSVRQFNGGNYNVEAKAAISAVEKILRTGIAYSSIYCNVPLPRERPMDYEFIVSKTMAKPLASLLLAQLPAEITKILDELQKEPSKLHNIISCKIL